MSRCVVDVFIIIINKNKKVRTLGSLYIMDLLYQISNMSDTRISKIIKYHDKLNGLMTNAFNTNGNNGNNSNTNNELIKLIVICGKQLLQTALYKASDAGNNEIVEIVENIFGKTDKTDKTDVIHPTCYNTNYRFHKACEKGDMNLVNLLISGGANDWNWGLVSACKYGHLEIIELMIIKGADDWNEGLYSACLHGFMQIAELMITKGADDLDSGLYYACINGSMELIDMLISKGTDNWNMGLEGACEGGHIEIVKLMIGKGANDWNEGFYNACKSGNMEIVKLILTKGGNCVDCIQENRNNGWDNTMKAACEGGNMEIVKLIDSKISDKSAGGYYRLGLMSACRGNNMEIIKLMLEKSAVDWPGALKNACIGGNTEIIEYIINTGGGIHGYECLWGACYGNQMEIAKMLISEGVDNWNVGLTGACSGGNVEMAEFMISKGANNWEESFRYLLNSKNYIPFTLFELLIGSSSAHYTTIDINKFLINAPLDDVENIKTLIKCGANDWNGGLIRACQISCLNMAKLMINHGATNLNECLVIACMCKPTQALKSGNLAIAELLIAKGANDWNEGLKNAYSVKNMTLAMLMISHGATNWRPTE